MHFFTIITQQSDSLLRIEAGELNVPTGKIVACDPFNNPERAVFTRSIPAGKYPVHLYLKKGENTMALAWLQVSQETPVTWEMAVLHDQEIADLKEGYYYGYSVDAGIGCFMDALCADFLCAAQSMIAEKMGDDFISYYDNVVAPQIAENQDIYLNHFSADDSELNVIMFSSGWGEGVFASYWGLDAAGNVACLVTDFNILKEGE